MNNIYFLIHTPISYLVQIKSVYFCYDLKLKLRLHLGKDLRKDKGCIEVVKHKDYRVVSTLYI